MTQVNDKYLKHVDVKNPELLEILNQYAKLHTIAGFEENVHLNSAQHKRQRPYYVGEKYMQEIVDQGTKHEGFPDEMVGYNFKLSEKACILDWTGRCVFMCCTDFHSDILH